MFRSTFLVIILAIFGFGIIFGLIGGVVGSMVEKQQSLETVESSSEADRVQEEAMEEEETQKTPQEIAAIKTYVEAGVMIVFLAILLWGMYSGSKDGTDIFQMADVNLLFTAPMKPQSVLMFRLSFQMVATVFASIYLVFQIPNLVVNMGLGASAVVAIFAGWILLLVFQRLMIVLTYTVCTTHEKLKPYVFPLIVGIVVLLGMIAGGTYLANGQNLLEAAHMTFANHWLRYLPVIGWYKGMIMCAVNGELFSFLVYLGLLLVSVAVLIFAIWHMKADFYEDALASAGKRAQMLEAAKEGRVIAGKAHAKKDGTIQCIESAYDFESEKFTVSLLKHEAQHAKDLKEYPDITPAELEYRAKLVELYYSSDWELLGKFLKMADADKVNDSHAMASMRIKEEFSDGTYEDLEKIKERALELFKINTRELRHGSK